MGRGEYADLSGGTGMNGNIKTLLERCDFWLAHLEDYTKGDAGDEITQLRSEIEAKLKHLEELG